MKRAGPFAKGVDAAEISIPGIKEEILMGRIKPSESAVVAVAKAAPAERRQMAEQLRMPKGKSAPKTGEKTSTARNSRQELKSVRAINADMVEADTPVSEDFVLEPLHGAVTDVIRVCDTLFAYFPRLLEDREYKSKVFEIM